MKILDREQTKNWDEFTIQHKPIKSIDLMEYASKKCVAELLNLYKNPDTHFYILCGSGNNGGDGLAIARLLRDLGYEVSVFLVFPDQQPSVDHAINLNRLTKLKNVPIVPLTSELDLQDHPNGVWIDAIFGSGLSRPIGGKLKPLIDHLNQSKMPIVSIDVPSGMDLSGDVNQCIIEATHTFTIQSMKESFFYEETGKYTGLITTIDIGLLPEYINSQKSNSYYLEDKLIKGILKHRNKFSHKGSFGSAALAVGKHGMMGAALLAVKACVRSGVGLTYACVPKCGIDIIQSSCPEAIIQSDTDEKILTSLPELDKIHALGIGCGIGTHQFTCDWLHTILTQSSIPLILDADALNIISQMDWLQYIPEGSIITPHPKEFDRLFGEHSHSKKRIKTQVFQSQALQINIVLKGAHTSIALPNGELYFNTTGNPGMAKGGSGDALTGLITGLRARGYTAKDACILGTYIHGMAGNLAAKHFHEESMLPSDLIKMIPNAFKRIYSNEVE